MSELQEGRNSGLVRGGGAARYQHTAAPAASLAEVLERVLDKGIVIAGDITISLAQVELLQIKLRLLVVSVDKAQELGINWWQSDPSLSTRTKQLADENQHLRERLEHLEGRLAPPLQPPEEPKPRSRRRKS